MMIMHSTKLTLTTTGIITCLFMMIAWSGKALADDDVKDRPHWSFEFKGGVYYPEEDQWDRFYGNDHTGQIGMALGYKFKRRLEFGIESYYIQDRGMGFLPLNDTTGGEVSINLYPVNLFLLYRAVFNENQIVVPYIGGGWTHMFYNQKITGQDNVDGSVDGYHLRAGIQFLLDNLDKSGTYRSASRGINNTYFFIEAESIQAEEKKTSSNLGGQLYTLGVLIEF